MEAAESNQRAGKKGDDLTNLTGAERAEYVRAMFTRIAQRYDLMNRIMTVGQDMRWRREVIRIAELPPQGRLLDLGAGTGDLAREASRQYPGCKTVAADFTLPMMLLGRQRDSLLEAQEKHLYWSAADACSLPFPEKTFEAVISGFLLRNVIDLRKSLSEQYRVLKPGGKIVILDTTPPARSIFEPAVNFYLHRVIPFLGRILAGQSEAYHYLPESTQRFLEPEQLAMRLYETGFCSIGFRRYMFGSIAIHWGQRP